MIFAASCSMPFAVENGFHPASPHTPRGRNILFHLLRQVENDVRQFWFPCRLLSKTFSTAAAPGGADFGRAAELQRELQRLGETLRALDGDASLAAGAAPGPLLAPPGAPWASS